MYKLDTEERLLNLRRPAFISSIKKEDDRQKRKESNREFLRSNSPNNLVLLNIARTILKIGGDFQ